MTTPLPSYVKTGRVLGRSLEVSADTASDADTVPDAIFPVGSKITFTPTVGYLVFTAQHDTVYLDSIEAQVGSDGLPKTKDGDELRLVANVGQTDNDQIWYWQVTPRISGGRFAPFRLDVTADVDNYLSDQQPIPAATADSQIVRGPAGAGAPPGGTADNAFAVAKSGATAWRTPTQARGDLGLGTMATQDSGSFASVAEPVALTKLDKSANLSDLASASTARSSLGLGTMATQSSGSYVPQTDKGANSGVATLDGSGVVVQNPKPHATRHAPGGADDISGSFARLPFNGQNPLTGKFHVDGYGAKGDGTTDDITAIQNCINAALAASGICYFTPGKNYKITAPILMGNVNGGSSRWLIEGNGATITQATDNTPIFKFTKESTYLWRIRGLNFMWSNNQTSSNTASACIFFDSDTNLNNGFYNFEIEGCRFGNGFRGVTLNEGSSNTNPVWGGDIHNIHSTSGMTGAVVRLRQTASGQPNMTLRQIYVRGDVGTETLIDMQGYQGLVLQNIEYNNTVGAELLLTTCNAVEVIGIRTESGSFTNNLNGVWTFSDCRGRISSIHVQSKTFTITNWAFIVRVIGSSCSMVIGNATVQSIGVGGGGQVALIQGNDAADIQVEGGFLNASSITKVYKFDNTSQHYSRDRGVRGALVTKTANYTIAVTDDIVFFNGATLTATLPAAGATTVGLNRQFVVKNLNSTTLTVGAAGGTIDGATTVSLAQYQTLRVITDGSNWYSV